MILDCPGSEWVLKMGPLTRTNQAGSRQTAEEGALRQVREAVAELLAGTRPLLPLLTRGARCAGDCGNPRPQEVVPDPAVVSYQLDSGGWLSVASSGSFGWKLVCRPGGE
jgi:hypothetical protein